MKKQNRKRTLNLDYIRQKQNQYSQQKQSGDRNKKSDKSSASSDFSEFQLESKDIQKIFKPFKKPRFWKKQSDDSKSVQKLLPKNALQSSPKAKATKFKHQLQNLNKKKETKNNHLISFKKHSYDQAPQFLDNQKNKTGEREKQTKRRLEQDQQLITQYDKKDFNNNSPQRQYKREAPKQRASSSTARKNKESNEQQILRQTQGGVCFDISITDFVHNQQKNKKKKQKKIKRNLSTLDLNSKEQILRRRQIAFRYGQLIRQRTFGYY